MKISFIVPAHNEEKYLGQCLASILEQTQKAQCDFEIIVVNNASTDKTREVALSFPGVQVIDESRKGLSQARQTGFLASTGGLIANIDADCRLPKSWLGTVIKTFSSNQNLVALSGPQIYYDLSSRARFWIGIYYYLAFASSWINSNILRVGSLLQGGNFIVRRKALEAIGGYNPAFTFYGEDTDIGRRLFKVGKVKFSLNLPIYASGRRLKTEGLVKMTFRYPLNYFWTTFFGRSFTKTSKDIR